MTIISVIKSNHDKRIHTNSIILLHKNIFFFFFIFFTYYALTPHTQMCITQPTDFLPSNNSNFYVRQLTTANTAYVFFIEQISKLHTQHKRESGTLRCWKKSPLKNNSKNQNLSLNHVRNLQNDLKKTKSSNDINANNFYLLYFPNRNGLKDETGNVGSKMCSISVALPR